MIKEIAILVILLMFMTNARDQLNMMYYLPILFLAVIYINTSKYEHFLCAVENKMRDTFRREEPNPDSAFGRFRLNTRNGLLKINKFCEDIILKI